ncbi:hypothetical protein HDV62DRAFT_343830 [Trichoderma sp. SZMC 28011]
MGSDKSPERRLLLALGLTLCAQAASSACGSAAWASRRRKEKTCRGWPHRPIMCAPPIYSRSCSGLI